MFTQRIETSKVAFQHCAKQSLYPIANTTTTPETMHSEKFVLIPQSLYKQQFGTEDTSPEGLRDVILNNKNIPPSTRVKMVSAAQRTPTVDVVEGDYKMDTTINHDRTANDTLASLTAAAGIDESRVLTEVDTPIAKQTAVAPLGAKIFQELDRMIPFAIRKQRSRQIFNRIMQNKRITIDPHTLSFLVDGSTLNAIDAVSFLYDLQVVNKNVPESYKRLLAIANIPQDLILNKKVKDGSPSARHSTPRDLQRAAAGSLYNQVSPISRYDAYDDDDDASFAEAQEFTPKQMGRGANNDQDEQDDDDAWDYTF